nr:hypothetical protein [uncultured Fusobacterium sp.]
MSEQIDVYVRIKYKKNREIHEDDLLEDIYYVFCEYSLKEFEKFLDKVKLK